MGILRSDRVSGLGGANAIKGSVKFTSGGALDIDLDGATIGTSNFTIEAWVYWFGGGAHQITGSSSNNFNFFIAGDDGDLKFYDGSSTFDFDASNIEANEWTHVALVRTGTGSNETKVYVNGVNTDNVTLNTSFSFDRFLTGINYLGGSVGYGDGYTSNLRFTLDTVYTSAFTPSNNELTVLDNTIVLCCQSPGNILQEATGKTIVPFKHGVTQSDAVASRFVPDKGEDHGTTFADNTKFDTLSYMVPPGGTTAQSNRGRAVMMGGVDGSSDYMTRIDFLSIPTMGNSIKFGDLSYAARAAAGAVSSSIRAIYAGGMGPASEVATNSMSYVTIATTGNGTDYGDLTAIKRQGEGCSNGVRGLFMGGENDTPASNTYNNVIDYATIATTGNAADFGDLTAARDSGGVCSSPIRGVCGGGYTTGNVDTIDYVTIATTGNATDFGNLTFARVGATGCASATRGLFMGGRVAPNNKSEIDYITIASTGNASDFGDLSEAKNQASATASHIRGVYIGGNNGSSPYNGNTMEFVTIASTGNTSDFGDTYEARTRSTASDCHGGLS